MSKYAHPDVLDNGLAYIKANANKMVLLSAYTSVYATAVGANLLAEVAMTPADYTLAGADGAARTLTTAAGKSDTAANASASGAPDLHIAFVDTVNSKVLWVTDETSNQAITAGNPVAFPQLVYTSGQPT